MSHRAMAPMEAADGRPNRWPSVALALTAIAAFLASRPSLGITHDNILYAAQALRTIDPSVLNRDLFFAYGSQDSYTLFSPVYGGLIRMLGLGGATRLLLVGGLALWLAAAWWLSRLIVPRHVVWLTLLIIAIYPMPYGGSGIFKIAEPFVTPRLFAEALGLGALAAFLAGRGVTSTVLLLVAAVLHPLVAAAPAAAILVTALLRNRPAWMIAAAVALASLLLLASLAAAHALRLPALPAIDDAWRAIAEARSPQLFIARWTADDWMSLAADSILLGLALGVAGPLVQRLMVAVLAVGIASVAVSFIGFDMLGDLRLGQLQVWRALWLMRVLAPIGLVLIICDAQQRQGQLRSLMLLLAWTMPAFAATSALAVSPGLLLAPLMLLAILLLRDRKPTVDAETLRRLGRVGPVVYLLFCAMALLLLARLLFTIASQSASFSENPAWLFLLQQFLPLLVLATGLGLYFMPEGPRFGNLAAASLAVPVICLLLWDQRSDWQRYLESLPGIGTALAVPVAPQEQVYWPGNLLNVWVGMGRASYFSKSQGAGLIFRRDTALQYQRRQEVVGRLEAGSQAGGTATSTTLADLLEVCRQPDGPDVIVLEENLPEARPQAWRAPVDFVYARNTAPPGSTGETTFEMRRANAFFFYRCSDVRAGAR